MGVTPETSVFTALAAELVAAILDFLDVPALLRCKQVGISSIGSLDLLCVDQVSNLVGLSSVVVNDNHIRGSAIQNRAICC